MKMNFKNSKRMGIVIGIILFVALVSGVTYAWLSYTSNSIPVADGITHCFNINYSNGGNIIGTAGIINESDYLTEDTISINQMMTFTSLSLELDSSCDLVKGIGTIELNVNSLDSFFTTTELNPLMYVLAEVNPSDYTALTIDYLDGEDLIYVARGRVSSTGTIDIYSEILEPGVTHTYLLILYIDMSPTLNGSGATGKTVAATVSARARQLHYAPISDFTYTTTSSSGVNYVILNSYTGTDTVVVLPDTYDIDGITYNTVLYGKAGSPPQGTFAFNDTITDVILPSKIDLFNGSSITSNSLDYVFLYSNLVNMPIIPSGVTSMSNTFSNCTNLKNSSVIPSSVTNMYGTFGNCSSLISSPVIPSNVTNVSNLFTGCTNLAGTIKFESSGISSATGTFPATKSIIATAPNGSTTYTTLNNVKPNNVTLVGY